MNNQLIVDIFHKLIELMKIENNLTYNQNDKNVNNYRIEALQKNMVLFSNMKNITSVDEIKNIKGVGDGTIKRVNEILLTGTLIELKYLKSKLKKLLKLNKLVDELCNVIGIGSITAIDLISRYNILSLDDLKVRVNTGSIKVNDKIKLGLMYEGKYETTIKRKYITKIYERIRNLLPIKSIICGSYRRGKSESHDIDLLLCDPKLKTMDDVKKSDILFRIIKKLKKNDLITDDITSDDVKTKYMGFTSYNDKLYRIDVRLVSEESWFAAMVYFTGSYQLNIRMRNKAKKLAYKLNEYGIYNIMGKQIPIKSEQDLFDILKLHYLEPEKR